MEIKVIYVDEDILVVDKPEGFLSVADGYDKTLPHLKPLLEPSFGQLWMVHRLDKDTSGVIVLARNAQAHKTLNHAFMDREVNKQYLCLASPCPDWEYKEVNLPLSVNTGRRHLTRVDQQNGKPALSSFKLIERHHDLCLLSCEIRTGYRHQIRAHLYSMGLGILGDTLYQPPQNCYPAKDFSRMMLHAHQLSIVHPGNNENLTFEAKTPKIFFEILNRLVP